MKMKLLQPLIIGLIFLCGATYLPAKSTTVDTGIYTSKDKEYYLTEHDIIFLRPGLEIEILEVVVPPDLQLEVTYSVKDSGGQPLDHYGITSPGEVDMRYTLANIPLEEEQKVRLAYERNSSNGTLTTIEPGVYKYKFDTVLSANTDTTHTLVLGGRRDLRDYYLDRYADNAVYDWVPSGQSNPVPRDVVTTETCNRCHDPLGAHGSRWQEVTACSQCHNPGLVEDGVSYSLDVLIHRVHNELEEGYPPEIQDCEVCHTGGTPTKNFPLVATPAAAMVCDSSGFGETTLNWEHTSGVEVHFRSSWDAESTLLTVGGPTGSVSTGKWVGDGSLFDLYDSETMELLLTVPVNTTTLGCVGNAPGSFRGEPGVQHTNWLDHSSREVCGSCHADVNFETGEGHSLYNLVQPDDSRCGNCHEPYTVSEQVQSTNATVSLEVVNHTENSEKNKQFGPAKQNSLGSELSKTEGLFYNGAEYDWSIRGAHTVLYKSAQLPGVVFKFIDITNTNAGEKPTVTFSVGGKNGFYNPADMNRLTLVLNGPNDDFSFYASESVGDAAISVGDNVWSYTFETPLPADAAGSYTVSMEGRVDVDVDFGGVIEGERDYAQNPLMAFAVTDESPVPRRTIVDNAKCESCHVNLSLHGGNRTQSQYCVTCHRPDLIDVAEVPESVNQRWMIHKIHRGEDLENGYVVIRSRGIYDFSHVKFSGDLRNCETCHVNGSEQLPTPNGLLPQITPNFWWSPIEPNASACLSCHDSDSAAVHAYSNTAFFGEACATCHGEGKSSSVDKVHAR